MLDTIIADQGEILVGCISEIRNAIASNIECLDPDGHRIVRARRQKHGFVIVLVVSRATRRAPLAAEAIAEISRRTHIDFEVEIVDLRTGSNCTRGIGIGQGDAQRLGRIGHGTGPCPDFTGIVEHLGLVDDKGRRVAKHVTQIRHAISLSIAGQGVV